jgi:hypothetical protein
MGAEVASGTLIAESLRRGEVLDAVPLTVRRVWQADVGDTSVAQPLTWTFIEFDVPAADAAVLADGLSRVMNPELGWYCDFRTPVETFVVFAGHVFRYPRADRSARVEAEAYARSRGVPESQLDWPE